MSNIAQHYRAAARDTADAIALLSDWIREPDADRSLLPADAIVTFGVMPPIGLGESRIDAVARYVLTLADSASGAGAGRGMRTRARMGAGRGMMGMGRAMMGGRGMVRRDTLGG